MSSLLAFALSFYGRLQPIGFGVRLKSAGLVWTGTPLDVLGGTFGGGGLDGSRFGAGDKPAVGG